MPLNNPTTYDATRLVDQMIGTAYPTVKLIAQNIEYIKHVSSNLQSIYDVSQMLSEINTLYNIAEKLIAIDTDLVQINAVYDNLIQINALYDDLTELNAIYNNLTVINTVEDNLVPINVVASDTTEINALYNNLTALLNLNTNIPDIYEAAETATTKAAEAAASAEQAAEDAESITTNGILAREFNPTGLGTDPTTFRKAVEILPGLHWYSDNIEDAYLGTEDTYLAAAGRTMPWNATSDGVFLPPGQYVYSGTGITLANAHNLILHAIPGTVSIQITNDVYLFDLSGLVQNIFIKGIRFVGGKGAIRLSGAASNVAGHRVIEDCYFDNYTECAIGELSSDNPYWKINRCMFMGVVTGGTIGIALGGYLDGTSISECAFLRNKYNIKLGDRLSGNISIKNCDFVAWTAALIEADIWIVPNTTEASGTNSGAPLIIEGNKFGNENISATKPRILIALEGTGTDRMNKVHSTTWNDTTAYMSGLIFTQNRISVDANVIGPFIYSYIGELRELKWDITNVFDGGSHTYLCEFNAVTTAENSYTTRTWDVDIGYSNPSQLTFSLGVTNNRLVGIVRDRWNAITGDESILLDGLGDPTVIPLVFDAGGTLDLGGSVTRTNVTDSLGNASRAAEITFAGTAGSQGVSKSIAALVVPTAERMAWVSLDLKRSVAQSMTYVWVEIFNYGNSKLALKQKVNIKTSWKNYIFPFIIPAAAAMSNWQVRVLAGDYSAGVTDRAQVGRVAVWQGRSVENVGHIKTLGTGLWNAEHLILGANHIWQTANGRLRTHTAAPAADTDGTDITQVITTWIPTILFGGLSTDIAYSVQSGTYVRSGRLVTIQGVIVLSNKGTAVGAATIGGLPFAFWGGGISHSGNTGYANAITATDGIALLGSAGGTTIAMYEINGGNYTALNDTDFANNSQIQFSMTYIVPPATI